MSETGTQAKSDPSIPPGAAIQGQLGPGVAGSGNLFFGRHVGETVFLYYEADPQGRSQASYRTGSGEDTPLQPNTLTSVPNDHQGVHVRYSVQPGGDMRLQWAWASIW